MNDFNDYCDKTNIFVCQGCLITGDNVRKVDNCIALQFKHLLSKDLVSFKYLIKN